MLEFVILRSVKDELAVDGGREWAGEEDLVLEGMGRGGFGVRCLGRRIKVQRKLLTFPVLRAY